MGTGSGKGSCAAAISLAGAIDGRRFRNTLRILLANLGDFDAATNAVSNDQLTLLDRWILERLHAVTKECVAAYDAYDFRKVFITLNQFCAVDLSALHVDITKDRLYCDAINSPRRRSAQTAMRQRIPRNAAMSGV